MKIATKISSLILALTLGSGLAFAQVNSATAEKAYKLMEQTNDVLAYHGDYSATMTLLIQKPGKADQSLKYKVFQRTDKDLMTIVQLFPEADKGTGYLRDGDNIWAYDPISRKFTHSSLKDALGDSDLNIDDVDQSAARWRENYSVENFEESTLGKYPVYVVTLKAKTSEPAYAKSVYYVRKDVPLVLKEEDFSGSGRLMRTTLLPKYTKVPAGYVPTQVILRDELNKGENTQEVITDLTFDKLPNTVFTKAYLEGLN